MESARSSSAERALSATHSKTASSFERAPAVGSGTAARPGHAPSFVGCGAPDKGNSRSPSPRICSPVIGPRSAARFVPKPCAGRWKVPGFGSRVGA
jgi:hypothetical protein